MILKCLPFCFLFCLLAVLGMASSSCLKQGSVPMNNVCVTPEATYEAVVADPRLFMTSLERLHSLLGTKFM